jgi:hypothetical protein
MSVGDDGEPPETTVKGSRRQLRAIKDEGEWWPMTTEGCRRQRRTVAVDGEGPLEMAINEGR